MITRAGQVRQKNYPVLSCFFCILVFRPHDTAPVPWYALTFCPVFASEDVTMVLCLLHLLLWITFTKLYELSNIWRHKADSTTKLSEHIVLQIPPGDKKKSSKP